TETDGPSGAICPTGSPVAAPLVVLVATAPLVAATALAARTAPATTASPPATAVPRGPWLASPGPDACAGGHAWGRWDTPPARRRPAGRRDPPHGIPPHTRRRG